MITEQQNEGFVQMPRKIKTDFLKGKLTKNEKDVLVWIWLSTNPVNGFFHASYDGLVQDFRREISNDTARKTFSALRKKQYIYFTDHKGRGGSFPVYPVDFKLTNGKIQTLEYLKKGDTITTEATTQGQSAPEPNHNFDTQNHNFLQQKQRIIKGFSMNPITTPYNDNKNNKYNNIDSKIISRDGSLNSSYKESKPVPVEGFLRHCKTYEQQQCWEIATKLGETDMRFLLSCLRDYGINRIERAWGIFKEQDQSKIEDKPKYFNKLIRSLGRQ